MKHKGYSGVELFDEEAIFVKIDFELDRSRLGNLPDNRLFIYDPSRDNAQNDEKERLPREKEELEADMKNGREMIKIFWQITESKYNFLRNIEGCKTLCDLDAVFKDRVHIERIVEGIGVLEVFQFFND